VAIRSGTSEQVRTPKAAELVAGSIRRRIVRGELREGDALPAEAELTQLFGVSRPTLREALRVLESESLITVSRGARAGARVHMPDREVAARYTGLILQVQGTTLRDIYDARIHLFAPAARLLAENHTKAAIARLRDEVRHVAGLRDDPAAFLHAGVELNLTLLELAGNQTMAVLAGMLTDIVDLHLAAVAKDWSARPSRRRQADDVVVALEHLVELIEAGRGGAAEAFWREQMTLSARYSLSLYGARTVVDLLG
jgi:DNA-binding FadR family transcriptional regulator